MLLTDQWQLIATNESVLIQKSNKSSVSLCYADQAPTTQKTFSLGTRGVSPFPASVVIGRGLYAKTPLPNQSCTLTIEKVDTLGLVSTEGVGVDAASTEYNVDTTLVANVNRRYLFIKVLSGVATTLTIGGGSGVLPLEGFYEPLVAPTGEVAIVTDGSVLVVEG